MKIKIHYCVFEQQGHFVVKYLAVPLYEVKEFQGGYDDPGEAIRQFKKHQEFLDAEPLSEALFQRRISKHQQDRAMLRFWQGGAKLDKAN